MGVKKKLPRSIRKALNLRKERRDLSKVGKKSFKTISLNQLINLEDLWLIFKSGSLNEEWKELEREIERMAIPENTGGVNKGDRRALYYLVRGLRVRSVLEIGTHIGASTAYILAALRTNYLEEPEVTIQMKSVDLIDVNNLEEKQWVKAEAKYSPLELANKLDMAKWIEFVTSDSTVFLESCDGKFDLIFLDGDHKANTVYREVSLALHCLNNNGLILLHDYFPNLKFIWKEGEVIAGPWLAAQRMCNEGAKLRILPLGNLPWVTKFGSNATSLALLAGR